MWRKLGIEPGEGRVFAWGAAALFLLGWSDVSVKNVSETFFIKRVGPEHLPEVFLVNSLLLVGTTWAFGRVATGSDPLKLLPRTLAGLALLLVPLWLLVRGEVWGVFPTLVIASKQITSIALLVFWIAMGDLLHGRQAKRLFAPMMAGVTLGTIVGSFASEPLGRWLGIDGLLPFSVGTLGACALATLPLGGRRPQLDHRAKGAVPGPQRAERQAGDDGAAGTIVGLWRSSPLFRLLFLTALCSGLLGPMLYFQFSYVADLATAGEGGEQRLLAFYAQFRGWISLAILALQLSVASSLYRRIGIPLAAAFSPLIYLLGFLGLSVQLSLPAGVGAMAGTKLQDNAVYDPALRILYSLFPESIRSRASAWIEGPVKRAGGAVGNLATLLALRLGSAFWVGYLALPIAAAWLGVALLLWRRYPRLLLAASATGSWQRDTLDGAQLLDPATVRALVPELCSPDPGRSRIAVELVSDAAPDRAVAAFAEAASRAPDATRPRIIAALDRVLETAVTHPVRSAESARQLEALLAEPERLGDRDRADLVQAYGRLMAGPEATERLERALDDSSPAVRLAALAALHRRGASPPDAPALDEALDAALAGDDPTARRTAREEFRALLLGGEVDPAWEDRLTRLASLLAVAEERGETAEALADVAVRHGSRAASVQQGMLALREDPDLRVREALLRYCGHARLLDQTSWLVEHLASQRPAWAAAAQEGLRALGPVCSETLLRELSFGRRSKREGILEVMRDLEVRPETLRILYETELDAVSRDLLLLLALGDRPSFALLHQRLEERVHEQLHTAVLFLAAIRREDRIAELGDRLEQARGRRRHHAILLEALEALLPSEDKERLVPLLEDQELGAMARAVTLGAAVPAVDEALRILRKDPEELTRTIATGLALAAGIELEDDGGVDTVEKALHLRALPIFEGLSARQLMDLAGVVKEQTLASEAVVVSQGEYDDCLYLVVEGVIHIRRGDTLLAEMGPGDFFGEIALFEGIARTATAVTRSRARLLGLERADLMRLIEEMPGIAFVLLQTLSRRLRELTDRMMV
jgi:hypothetical protein